MKDVIICEDKAALNREAANRFAGAARTAVEERGRFLIALAGGSTPKPFYELLASREWQAQVDWGKTHLFWGDERFVPADDAKSNYRMVCEALISRIEIPPGNIHRVLTESGTPEQVAAAYEQTIRDVFGGGTEAPALDYAQSQRITETAAPQFDFILLGLGDNGHTASLFPHSSLLHETQRLVAADFVQEVGDWRITMTLPLINRARTIAFLVSGVEKAGILHKVLSEKLEPERYPAQWVRPASGKLLWLVDAAAASLLRTAA